MKFFKKIIENIKIKRAKKKYEKYKSKHSKCISYRQEKYRKLSREFREELSKQKDISFEKYQKIANDIFERDKRKSYVNFMIDVQKNERKKKNGL